MLNQEHYDLLMRKLVDSESVRTAQTVRAESAKLAKDIEDFLAKGGEIKHIPFGTLGYEHRTMHQYNKDSFTKAQNKKAH